MANLYPILSSSPIWSSVGENFSWITIDNDIPRPLYAQAVYNVNNGNNYYRISQSSPRNDIGQVLSANLIRKALYCRNYSQEPLFVKFGLSASDTDFHVVLKGSDDGFGESFTDNSVYQGDVSVYYTVSGLYSIWEGF
jgi:hypothetical protein